MKQILFFLLFLCPAIAFAQWPASPNKMRLGNQTTGDGLIYRSDSLPDYLPTSRNNAWWHFDTIAKKLYFHEGGTWQEFTPGGGIDTSGYNLAFSLAGDSLHLTDGAGTLSVHLPGLSGEANTASNLGAGTGIFASKVGVDLQFKSIAVSNNLAISSNSTTVTISQSYAYYTNDASAASGGVAVGDAYKIDIGNPYGMTWGTLKTRNE